MQFANALGKWQFASEHVPPTTIEDEEVSGRYIQDRARVSEVKSRREGQKEGQKEGRKVEQRGGSKMKAGIGISVGGTSAVVAVCSVSLFFLSFFFFNNNDNKQNGRGGVKRITWGVVVGRVTLIPSPWRAGEYGCMCSISSSLHLLVYACLHLLLLLLCRSTGKPS